MNVTVLALDLDGASVEELVQTIGDIVETLVARNRRWLRSGRPKPPLYTTLARYRPNPRQWQDAATVLRTFSGDCKDFVAWRLAELREESEDARCHVVVRDHEGRRTFHVQICRGDGSIEDPSIRMGMLEHAGALDADKWF